MADVNRKQAQAGHAGQTAVPPTPATPSTATVAATVAAPPASSLKSEAELVKLMSEAMRSGDFKQVAKVAAELVKFQKTKEETELAAKQAALAKKNAIVLAAIEKALAPIIKSGELDQADGVWFTQDFGEKLAAVRLYKTQPHTSTGKSGGRVGKKFSVSSNELLGKFGEQVYKDGMSFEAAWDSNADKNWRYGIREALLKLSGTIS